MKMRFPYSLVLIAFVNLCAITNVEGQQFMSNHEYDIDVLKSFYQGNKGDFNCAAISVVKCAIATFGADNVFKSVTKDTNGLRVTLRNSEIAFITQAELKMAADSSGFMSSENNKFNEIANLIYAIMVKRAVGFDKITFASCTDFNKSLMFLHGETGGVDARKLPQLLGLKCMSVAPKRNFAYVHENGYHAVFASQRLFDNFGTPYKLNLMHFRSHFGLNPIMDLESINFIVIDA